jgi:tyrosyl-tRNA synthetase
MWLYTKQFDWEKMWAIADNITDEAAIRKLLDQGKVRFYVGFDPTSLTR